MDRRGTQRWAERSRYARWRARSGRRFPASTSAAGSTRRSTVRTVRQALLDHLVIFFRDQDLTAPDQFLAFARAFGRPVEYPFVKGLPWPSRDHRGAEARARDGEFRRHLALRHHLPGGAADGLHPLAREIPPYGGDTLFANMYLADETLSPGMRRMLDGLDGSRPRPRRTCRRPARTG